MLSCAGSEKDEIEPTVEFDSLSVARFGSESAEIDEIRPPFELLSLFSRGGIEENKEEEEKKDFQLKHASEDESEKFHHHEEYVKELSAKASHFSPTSYNTTRPRSAQDTIEGV